jgi:hypothetical protein
MEVSFWEFFCGEKRLVAFLNQNFILISKTTRDWDCVTSFLIPLFAKNSRLGYFLNANNLHGE